MSSSGGNDGGGLSASTGQSGTTEGAGQSSTEGGEGRIRAGKEGSTQGVKDGGEGRLGVLGGMGVASGRLICHVMRSSRRMANVA
jgi:hypothetical protein